MMVHHEQVVVGGIVGRVVERQGGPAVGWRLVAGSIWFHWDVRLAVGNPAPLPASGGAKKKPPRFGTGGAKSLDNDQNPRGAVSDTATTPMAATAKA